MYDRAMGRGGRIAWQAGARGLAASSRGSTVPWFCWETLNVKLKLWCFAFSSRCVESTSFLYSISMFSFLLLSASS